MITNYLIIAAVILVIAILLVFLIWRIRSRRFRPDSNKLNQQNELNADLEETGFAYELKGDYFYSLMDCWQRKVGYCHLYDEAAPLFNMIMDCEPVTFSYAGKRWLIELWKGQYGITTGAEIGIYHTEQNDIDSDKFKGTFYENISDNERMKMSFVLRRNKKVILKRNSVHWWLTGFKLGMFSETSQLTMDAKITFPDRGMRNAFVESLTKLGYHRKEYSVSRNTVSIHYTTPHFPQTESRSKIREALVQKTNRNNCRLYEFTTGKYSDTLDKLEYLKAMAPELYQIFIDSLYARGVYEAFDWIQDWLGGSRPEPGPDPDPHPPVHPCPPPVCPCPPGPCPCPPPVCPRPEPPCPCPPPVCPRPEPPCPRPYVHPCPPHHCQEPAIPSYEPHRCQEPHVKHCRSNDPACLPGHHCQPCHQRQCFPQQGNQPRQRNQNSYEIDYRNQTQDFTYEERQYTRDLRYGNLNEQEDYDAHEEDDFL